MRKKIINFIRILRESNVPISISEVLDCFKALQKIDITNKNTFKITLKTTLIKHKNDLKMFNKIFKSQFKNIENKQVKKISKDQFNNWVNHLQDLIKEENFNDINNTKDNNIEDDFSSFDDHLQQNSKIKTNEEIYTKASESDIEQLAQQLTESEFNAQSNNDLNNDDNNQDGLDGNNGNSMGDISNITEEIMQQNELNNARFNAIQQTGQHMKDDIDNKFDLLKEKIQEQIEDKVLEDVEVQSKEQSLDTNDLMDKDLAKLTLNELELVEEMIKKIVKKIITDITRRQFKSKHGRVDIKKTIKKSIRYGTIGSELCFKQKKKNKTQLVTLCDISGSVKDYVPFMLQVIIGIQKVFKDVSSYIFIDKIKNITDEVEKSNNIKETINQYVYDNTLGNGTDYGNVFHEFSKEDVFNNKTILIIFGDAENTGNKTGTNYLKKISSKCKKVFWLNPDNKNDWYNAYSELKSYKKHCNDIKMCNTLKHLDNFLKRLIKI
jgi:uncharacterized protein with von Willebrand factor type A (vWA) domain